MTNNSEFSPNAKEIVDHVRKIIDVYCWADVVGFNEGEDGILTAELNFKVSLPSKSRRIGYTHTGVRKIEPVILRFFNYPLFSPLLRLRGDFNRNLPHINPNNDQTFVSPCLYQGGTLSELMHRQGGLITILQYMKEWLDRAARNGLYDAHSGWEPIVLSEENGCIVADVEDKSVIDLLGAPLSEYLTFFIINEEESYCHALLDTEMDPSSKNPFPQPNKVGQVVTFVIKGDVGYPSERRDIGSISTLGDIYRLLSSLRVKGYLRSRLNRFIRDYKKSDKDKTLNFFILVAVPRPVHISGSDSIYEYLPFWVKSPLSLDNEEESTVRLLGHRQKITPKFSSRLSGVPFLDESESPIVMIGCGSLGSKLALHLAKSGVSPFHLIDKSYYSPHNAIRHGIVSSSQKLKVSLLKDELKILGVKVTTDRSNVVSTLQKKLGPEISSAKLIVDSTASAQVRQSLTLSSCTGRVVNTAFHAAGQASHLLMEGKDRNPRVDDLYAFMISEAANNSLIKKMLFNEDVSLMPQPIGQGCTSVTMIMSDADASMHTASHAKILLSYLTNTIPGSGEYWFALPDEQGVGVGPYWVHKSLELTTILPSDLPDNNGWEVRILAPVLDCIDAEKGKSPHRETGGALFGQVNSLLRRIIVTSATPPPADSHCSRNKFIMGTSGLREATEELEKVTHGNLTFLGTWHSHISDEPPSPTDKASLAKFSHLREGPPFVMLVSTPNMLLGLVDSEI